MNKITHIEKLILVTNDDGINSPGIKAAVEAVIDLGKVIVVAPAEQQTSAGRSMRGGKNESLLPVEFKVNGKSIEAYCCNCAPALAVCHAINILFTERLPDLLVSGINFGENLGTNITISGTVGAALEAASFGIKCIAASRQTDIHNHHTYADLDWSASIHFLKKFAVKTLQNEFPEDVDILKIDVPACADKKTDWRLTTVSRQPYFVAYQENPDIKNTIGDAKLKIEFDESKLEHDSDIKAIFYDKVVSVSPVSMNLTSRINFSDFEVKLR